MSTLNYASRIKRLINWIVDLLIILIFWGFILFLITKLVIYFGLLDYIPEGKTYTMRLDYTVIPIYFLYYLIFEGIFKTTIGKLVTKTKAIRINGNNIRFSDALIRTVFRFIPLEQLSYLSEFPVGWHDSISNTRVINKN